MGTVRRRGQTWRAEVAKAGVRRSATFDTKAEAWNWIEETEGGISTGKGKSLAPPNATFGKLMQRYIRDVSPSKKGHRWNEIRVNLLLGDPDPGKHKPADPLAHVSLDTISSVEVAAWRDRRLQRVSDATVRREWTLFSAACNIAIKEWRWLDENPFHDAKRPAPPASRDRLATDDEIERILLATGYDDQGVPTTVAARVGAAVVFAVETAMRAGEICALRWRDVEAKVVVLSDGKTRAAARRVPLSGRARTLLQQLRGAQEPKADALCFGLTSRQIDANWRKCRDRALVSDLHFHDLRHVAITRLAKRISLLDLARAVGHKDLRMLQVYYNESADAIADRLD